ncbi:hypothetical protein PIB30_056954 [Stylosanthes scabra]|uniref:F-box domain-containing protein n=1 Tax=Stylosanthes scabra TaxID=79078 RepID=A0ABU6WMB3_9FABA|nr:hypothetical protein [Stylosanthes scabra]
MDGLSDLPKAILHDIQARLPDKDAAKTSALSKAWRDAWFSFPNLSICSQDFFTIHDVSPRNSHRFSKMDILIDSVTKRLMRLGDRGLAIKEFKLNLKTLYDLMHVSHHMDLWIQMASDCGVEVLELHLTYGWIGRGYIQNKWYDLPLCVIEAKSLTKLVLASGIRIDQEFLSHSMKFSSLKLLSLSGVLFTQEGVIEHLIAHCPRIEHLTVKHCFVYNHLSPEVPQVYRIYRMKSLFLNGLQKLKQVDIHEIQEVHVDSPNLENLLFYIHSNHSAPFKLNFNSCTNLRCLSLCCLRGIDFGDKWFLELFSKFPFLERLKLDNCSMSRSINISSTQLKVLELLHCSNLKEVNIYAQNLSSFVYRGIHQPVISFLRSSKQLEVKGYHCSLREFVKNIKPQNILASASLFISQLFPIEPKQGDLIVSSIPPSIKGV